MDSSKALSVIQDGDFTTFMTDENGNRRTIPETFRVVAQELVRFHDKAKIALAETLYEIHSNEYYKDYGYPTFQAYLESDEMDFQYRQGMYLVKIWEVLIKKRGIPEKVLRNKSWSKLKEIAAAAEHTEIDTDDVVKMIEASDSQTVEEVTFAAKKAVEDALSSTVGPSSVEKITRVTFNLYPEQLENVKKALDVSMEISDSTKSGANLDYICTGFLAGHIHGDEKEELKRLAKVLEGCAGVKVLIAKDEEVIYANKDLASGSGSSKGKEKPKKKA